MSKPATHYFVFSIYQITIRRLVDKTIDTGTQRIILKIVRFVVGTSCRKKPESHCQQKKNGLVPKLNDKVFFMLAGNLIWNYMFVVVCQELFYHSSRLTYQNVKWPNYHETMTDL